MSRSSFGARAVWVLTVAVGLTAMAIQWWVVAPLGAEAPTHRWHVPAIAVAVGFGLAEVFVVRLRLGRDAYAFSLSEIPLIVGLFFANPELLVVARLGSAALVFAWRRTPPRKAAFNLALFALEVTVAVVLWHAVLGDGEALGPRGWTATLVVALATSMLGSGLVSLAISLHTSERASMLSDVLSLGQVADLVNAVFALVVVYVVSVDWRAGWILAVIIFVLVLAQRGYARLQSRNESLEQIDRFTSEVGQQVDVDAVMAAVLTRVRAAAGAETAQIRLHENHGDDRQWGLGQEGDAVESGGGSQLLNTFDALPSTEPLLVPRSTKDPALRAALVRADVRDVLAVALCVDGHRIGTLAVANRMGDRDTFTKDDAQQVVVLANHAAVALSNTARAEQLRKKAAEREHEATHDELTGLVNWRKLSEDLGDVLTDRAAAVLLLDLDRFKEVNDTMGHQVGDDLLRLVAERLVEVAPTYATVARFGGDEFAILLPETDQSGALACASMVIDGLSRPFDLVGLSIAVDASVGVALAAAGDERVSVVRQADVAMYAAKASRRGVEVYRQELDAYDPARLGLLADLRDAIAANTFSVVYQPKVDIADGHVHGVEALVRWNHPLHGPIGPDDFIPLAENSGLITPLTMLVMRSALEQNQAWRAAGLQLTLAVNISTRSLLDPTFADQVARILASVALPADALTLEITETSLMAEPERAIAELQRLSRLGLRLSVDDLGTGHSSLAYLQRLPVDEIKIDRSFLQALPDEASEAVVGAIVDLGHRLDRQVVAEGVENEFAWHRLRALGCDVAQGYWISRPIPAELVRPFVESWHDTWLATDGRGLSRRGDSRHGPRLVGL